MFEADSSRQLEAGFEGRCNDGNGGWEGECHSCSAHYLTTGVLIALLHDSLAIPAPSPPAAHYKSSPIYIIISSLTSFQFSFLCHLFNCLLVSVFESLHVSISITHAQGYTMQFHFVCWYMYAGISLANVLFLHVQFNLLLGFISGSKQQ